MAKTFGSGWTRDMGLLSVADASVTVVNPLSTLYFWRTR
jgi:thioredoxin 1